MLVCCYVLLASATGLVGKQISFLDTGTASQILGHNLPVAVI